MEIRLKFLPGQQREFLLEIQEKSGLSTDEIAKIAGIVSRSYRDWKREKCSISLKVAEDFCKKFDIVLPEEKHVLIKRWKKSKLDASRKGGFARLRKYGDLGTLEGRRKGGSNALRIMREKGIIPVTKKFDLPTVFSDKLAEWVGIVLGDGGITAGQVQITLNSKADRDYIPFVTSLGKELFGEEPKIYYRDNTAILYYNGVKLIDYFIDIGLKIGNKVKQQVDVPQWIKESKDFGTACLRGLADTDGGIFRHAYKVNNKEYVYYKFSFSNRSMPLIHFAHTQLLNLGLNPKLATKMETKHVWLYNKDATDRYLEIVGTHNPRLLKHKINQESGPDGKAQVC